MRALPWILAVAAAAGCFRVVLRGAPEPVELTEAIAPAAAGAAYVEAVERGWIESAFPEVYLPAPVTDLPCPTGVRPPPSGALRVSEALAWVGEGRLDDALSELEKLDARDSGNWLAGLTQGMLLAREGRLAEADAVLESVYGRPRVQTTIRTAIEAAAANRPRSGPPSADVRAAIHLLHAYGYVLVETHRGGGELWHALRNPIGCAKLLALRGDTDQSRRLPTWAEHRLAAPGCGLAEHSLTTLDLYNNLIVGYLENPDFHETAAKREQEFARSYNDPPQVNPLLAVLRAAEESFPSERWPADREHWLWAVSNAERLLKQRRESAVGELDDARLAHNLAALMESALPRSPPAAREALRRRKNALLATALDRRGSVLPRQAPELHRGIARLKLLEAVRAGAVAPLPDEVLADLDEIQRRALADVGTAVARRAEPAEWAHAAAANGTAPDLGDRTEAWRRASRRDLAAGLARRGDAAPEDHRPRFARWARGVLEPGDEPPAELAELERDLGFWWRISPRRLLSSWPAAIAAAAVAGSLAWLLGAWLAIQLGRRQDLFTSFYRHEARRRLREGRFTP